MTMGGNLFSEKFVSASLVITATLFASSTHGAERNSAEKIMKDLLSQKFVEIVNQEIQPTNPFY